MSLNNNKILYLYFNARKERITKNEINPSEFFYGYDYFYKLDFSVSAMEFDGKPIKFLTKILLKIQKLILKVTKFQYDFAGIFKSGKFKEIISNDVLIISNNRIAHSILPALIYMKYKNKKSKTIVIAMGIFNFPKSRLLKKIHLSLNSFLLRYIDYLIFIGKKEYEHALQNFEKYNNKLIFIPFGVDSEFWKSEKINNNEKKSILFIGNDSNRDFDFLINFIAKNPNENFVVVTEYFEEEYIKQLNLNNLTFYKGSWNKKILTDDFLKKLYEDSKVTLVPLKNSIQPSGQSVSLQSISMKTPVIITKTDGFWDTEFFENKKNIFFAQNNSIEEWQSLLNELLSSDNIYSDIQSAGRNLIVEKFDVQNFNRRLHELLED